MDVDERSEIKYVFDKSVGVQLSKNSKGYTYDLKISGVKDFEIAITELFGAKKVIDAKLKAEEEDK